MPEKFWMDTALGIPVGVTASAAVWPDAGVAVDNVTNKRKARRREFMRRSHWLRRHWASSARAERDWIKASSVPSDNNSRPGSAESA
jgi:hypothetical protein